MYVRVKVASVMAIGLLMLSGCSGQSDQSSSSGSTTQATSAAAKSTSLNDVKVSGAVNAKPTVQVNAPLVISKAEHKTVTTGKGDKLAAGQQVTANLTMVSGQTGQILQSSYDDGQERATFPMDTANGISQDLFDALNGVPVGSRVMVSMQGAAQQGQAAQTLVYIIDIVKQEKAAKQLTRAEGKEVPPKSGLPTVTRASDGKPSISKPEGTPSKSLISQPVIEGTGKTVEKGQKVTVQYSGWLWTDNTKTFDSSWGKQPFSFTVGGGEVIKAWDEGFVGKKVGSQILLIVPPDKGYGANGSPPTIPGNSTLVFVVDILGAV